VLLEVLQVLDLSPVFKLALNSHNCNVELVKKTLKKALLCCGRSGGTGDGDSRGWRQG